jgi:hypothetical protein
MKCRRHLLYPLEIRSTDSRIERLEPRALFASAAMSGLSDLGAPQPCQCPVCHALAAMASELTVELNSVSTANTAAQLTPGAIPTLSSRPGATAKLCLDFDGDPSAQGQVTPAFDTNGDVNVLTQGEVDAIYEIWARVSEIYSPFNLDVTTIDPGNRADKKTMQIVIGGDGAWAGGGGGLAYIDGFNSPWSSNTGFIFPSRLANNTKIMAVAAAHEAGHGFGLYHQATWSNNVKTNEYNPGTGALAPIMGLAYWSNRGTWWNGTTSTAPNIIQDDMVAIAKSANGFGYRADDYGSTVANAFAPTIVGGTFSASGVIEQTADLDLFRFTTVGGSISANLAVAAYGAMLDATLQIWDASGNVVASAATTSLGESLNLNLASGTYYAVVRSAGNYGDVGQYTLSVNLPTGTVAPVANAGSGYAVSEGGSVSLSAAGSSGSILTYEWDLDGDGIFGETGAGAQRGNETGLNPTLSAVGLDGPSTYIVSLRVTDSDNQTDTTTASISVTNVAPVLTVAGSGSANEGSTYTLNLSSTDVGNDTIQRWNINWGDGTSSVLNAASGSANKVYADNGAYVVSVTATDEDGTYSASTHNVSVANVAPVLSTTIRNNAIIDGELILDLSSTDVGNDTIGRWTISWGDGTVTTLDQSAGAVSKHYADHGTYTIHIVATDEDGTYHTSRDVSLADTAQRIAALSPSWGSVEQAFAIQLSTDNPNARPILTWTVDWGDGRNETFDGSLRTLTTQYAAAGNWQPIVYGFDGVQTHAVDVTPLRIYNPTLRQAQLPASSITTAAPSFFVDVIYASELGIEASQFQPSNLAVSQSFGDDAQVSVVSTATRNSGRTWVVRYAVSVEGGWDYRRNGSVTVTPVEGAVVDRRGRFVGSSTDEAATVSVSIVPTDTVGNSMRTALRLPNLALNRRVSPREIVGPFDSDDYYLINVPSAGVLTATMSRLSDDANIQLLHPRGKILARSESPGASSESFSTSVVAGTYYIRVSSGAASRGTSYFASLLVQPASTTPPRSVAPRDIAGNTLQTAAGLRDLGSWGVVKAIESVSPTDQNDYFRFNLTAPAMLNATLSSLSSDADLEILDSAGNVLGASSQPGTRSESVALLLSSGVYYARVVNRSEALSPFALRLESVQPQLAPSVWSDQRIAA